MKCHEATGLMTELFDIDTCAEAIPLDEHLKNCPECHFRFEEMQRALKAVQPVQRVVASQHFKERAMKAILVEAQLESTKSEGNTDSRGWPKWVALACAAILLVLVIPSLPVGGGSKAAGLKLLAQSVEAMSNLQTVHIVGRMRTLPVDNFELIGTNYEFVPIQLWREYGNPSRWRIEKTGRVVVMDGQSSTLFIPSLNSAMKGTPDSGFVEWLRPLLNPESILQSELDAARKGTAEIKVSQSGGMIVLTVHQKGRGDFANSWAKDKSIEESDHTCVYRFDAATKRLEGLQVAVHVGTIVVNVLELTEFRYNESFSPTLFNLQLPADVIWLVEPTGLRPSTANLNGPSEAAQYFLDALARRDWNAVMEVLPTSRVDERFKQGYGGLQVISIDTPFKSGLYPGYYVPYKLRLQDGSIKEWKLAVRNDNPLGRWIVDGGF